MLQNLEGYWSTLANSQYQAEDNELPWHCKLEDSIPILGKSGYVI